MLSTQRLLLRQTPKWTRIATASNKGAITRALYHTTIPTSSAAAAAATAPIITDPAQMKLAFRERLKEEQARALMGGGPKRVKKQHAKGSLTARERMELLFDGGEYHELDQLKAHRCVDFEMDADSKQFPGDGIVTG
jgi:acetyl-CoA carboxylase carboxyltransferase component